MLVLPDIVPVLSALGIGAILTKTAQTIIERIGGKADREQSAWEQRDAEAAWRRLLQEYIHTIRALLHKRYGLPYEDMPPIPERPKK